MDGGRRSHRCQRSRIVNSERQRPAGQRYSPRVGKLEHTPVALRDLVGDLRRLLVNWGWKTVADRIEGTPRATSAGDSLSALERILLAGHGR